MDPRVTILAHPYDLGRSSETGKKLRVDRLYKSVAVVRQYTVEGGSTLTRSLGLTVTYEVTSGHAMEIAQGMELPVHNASHQ